MFSRSWVRSPVRPLSFSFFCYTTKGWALFFRIKRKVVAFFYIRELLRKTFHLNLRCRNVIGFSCRVAPRITCQNSGKLYASGRAETRTQAFCPSFLEFHHRFPILLDFAWMVLSEPLNLKTRNFEIWVLESAKPMEIATFIRYYLFLWNFRMSQRSDSLDLNTFAVSTVTCFGSWADASSLLWAPKFGLLPKRLLWQKQIEGIACGV